MDKKERIIADVMENFRFDKVHAFMVLTDWVWNIQDENDSRVPTIEEIKAETKLLLSKAYDKCKENGEDYAIKSGGLYVECNIYGEMNISFVAYEYFTY